jgi:hypothetical protein
MYNIKKDFKQRMKEWTVKPSSRYSLVEGCCKDSSHTPVLRETGIFLSVSVTTTLQANGSVRFSQKTATCPCHESNVYSPRPAILFFLRFT